MASKIHNNSNLSTKITGQKIKFLVITIFVHEKKIAPQIGVKTLKWSVIGTSTLSPKYLGLVDHGSLSFGGQNGAYKEVNIQYNRETIFIIFVSRFYLQNLLCKVDNAHNMVNGY